MTYPFPYKPLREQLSFKQREAPLLEARDRLGAHYRLNKSDLVKYLIKKEIATLQPPDRLMEISQ